MKTELVPGAHKIDSLELIKSMVRKKVPWLSDQIVNNIAQGVYDHYDKNPEYYQQFAGFWDDAWNTIKPDGLIRTITSAVNTVVDTVDEFVSNISFKNAFNPSEWRADPVKKAVARLEKGANELGEIISIPDWLDEVIEYTSYAVGTGLTVIGLPMVGSAVIVGGKELAKAVDAIDKVKNNVKAINNAVSEVSETIEETEQTLTSLKDNLKEYDFSLDEIINNANIFENKINSAVDKMTIFSDTAKTDLKSFISSEAEISKMTGALPMDIKDLLDGINTAPAELQEKLSAGIKAINARAESAIRMAQGVETLQKNFIKLGKENIKLIESIKTDAATNKFNLDEIKLADYKTENKIRIYRQLLSDKNQIIKRLTADVGKVKTYIADKATMQTDEIENLTAKIQELEDSLDYVYSIVSDELEDLL